MNDPVIPNSAIDVIYKRASVRSYTSQKLDPGTIRMLLDAAVRAPTAILGEPWAFVVIQDTALIKRLSDESKKVFMEEARRIHHDHGASAFDTFKDPNFNFFFNAGTLIIICGKSMGLFVVADCWLAAENLIIAACAMGLGTCVIGSAVSGLNSPEVKAELGIPAEFSIIAPIVIGVPDGEVHTTPRKEPRILAWK